MDYLSPQLTDVLLTVVLILIGFVMGRMTKNVIFKDGAVVQTEGLPKINLDEEEPVDPIDDAVPDVIRKQTIMRS